MAHETKHNVYTILRTKKLNPTDMNGTQLQYKPPNPFNQC